MNIKYINKCIEMYQKTKNPVYMNKIKTHINRFWNKFPTTK